MAIAHRSDSSGEADGTFGGIGSVTITKPTGTASTDVLICVVPIGGSHVSDTITTPTDWTRIAAPIDQSDGTNRVELYAFWALGSTSNLTFNFTGLTLNSAGWVCSAFTGVDNTTPIDVAGTSVGNTGATSLSAGALTIVNNGAWEMVAAADILKQSFSAAGHTTTDNGAPASYQSAALLYNTTPQSVGSTGAIVVAASGTGTGQILTVLAFALKPDNPFTISPSSQTVRVNDTPPIAITLNNDNPATSATFSDASSGGVFSPPSFGALSADTSFTYSNATPGTYTITVTLNGAWGAHTANCTVVVWDTLKAYYSFASQTTGTASALPLFDDAVGVVNSGTGDTYTCITIDNGGSTGFTSFNGRVAFSWTPSEIWEYSSNGSSWTTFVPTASVSYTPGAGTYSEVDVVWTPGATITARYIRLTIKDHPSASQVSTAGIVELAAGTPQTSGGGSFAITGTLTRGDGSPWSNMQVSICYKVAGAPEIRVCHLQNPSTPGGQYCADGDWSIASTTTDCNGAWSYSSGAGNIRAVNVFLGPMRVNPHWDKESNDGNPTYGWPNWAYIIADNSVSEWAHVFYNNSNGAAHTSTGTLPAVMTGVGIPTSLTDCSNVIGCSGIGFTQSGAQILAGPSIGTCRGGYAFFTNAPVFVTGAWTLNTVIGKPPIAYFVAKAFGNYYDIGHPPASSMIDAIIADSCSHSGHIRGGTPDWLLPTSIDWWLINSVTGITFNPGFDCSHLSAILSCPHFDASSAVQIYPSNQLHAPVQTERYNADYNSVNPALSYKHKTLMILVEDCTSTPDMPLVSATTFDGALNVAWVSGGPPGALKTAVHLHPSLQIGASTVGWQSTQTIEATNVSGCGIIYLPEGRLELVYSLSDVGKYRYNEQRGTGVAGDWTAVAASQLRFISGGGLGQEQAFTFLAGPGSTAGAIAFYQNRDGQGKNWTTPVTAIASTGQGPLCGGVFTGNQYGLLYTRHSDGKVFYLTTSDPSTWTGTGTDTTFTGNVCGMAKHPSGRLVGVLQASAGGAVKAIYSSDNGLTWTDVALSITPTPPPVIVEDGGTFYVVYIESDAPKFQASVDSGATWV